MTTEILQDRSICVIGLGYVGLPTAALLARAGHEVLGVDIDREVVSSLNEGKTALNEDGLLAVVEEAFASGRLRASGQAEPADIFIICVPTPVTPNGTADLAAVRAATMSIASVVQDGNLVILESTSPAGTTRDVVGRILRESGAPLLSNLQLCYCPERVLPGDTVGELERNSRIIGGTTPAAADRAARMYRSFCTGEMCITEDRVAELCKLMENTYRDINIAIANVFARIGEEAGVDIHEAIRLANLHPRVDILTPGPGVGGHCIPVDPWFIIEGFPASTGLLREARQVNDGQAVRLLDRLTAAAKLVAGDTIAILGVAYKGNIDDPRESPTLRLIDECKSRGIRVRLHDPHVQLKSVGGAVLMPTIQEATADVDAIMIMTDHSEYATIDPLELSVRGPWIADGRGIIDQHRFEAAGFRLLTLGVGRPELLVSERPLVKVAP